jgi:hypothetical protein
LSKREPKSKNLWKNHKLKSRAARNCWPNYSLPLSWRSPEKLR